MEIGLHNLHLTEMGDFEVSTVLFSRNMETVLLSKEDIPEILREYSDFPEITYSFEDAETAHNALVEKVRDFLDNHTRKVIYTLKTS